MAFTRQYKQFLRPEKRIAKGLLKPRNIYRITTYQGGKPATKSGENARYVFAIGKVGDKLHCLKLNEIKPSDFTHFISQLRDKRIPLTEDTMLHLFLKKYSPSGDDLFLTKIKNNQKVYSPKLKNYRTYFISKIQNVYEIRFEQPVLEKLFGEVKTITQQREIIQEEINDVDDV
jgi:hypothetical protein